MRERKEMTVVVVGTCLNVDDRAAVRVVVEEYSVKFECAGTEIVMDADSLAQFITIGEEVLPELAAHVGMRSADALVPDRSDSADTVAPRFETSASTWVICDATDRIRYLTVGGRFELNWGGRLVWTISAGALARLLDRARRARPVLDEHVNIARRTPPDQEIPEIYDDVAVTG